MNRQSDLKVMLKEAGILFAITVIAGFLLGFVYELTKEPRRIQEEKAVQKACAAVFPEEEYTAAGISFRECVYTPGTGLTASLAEAGVTVGKVFEAAALDGTGFGYVVEAASANGYGGEIVLYVGVRMDGTVNGVSILKLNETPGLGMEAQSVLAPQFAGKKVDSFTYTKTGARPDSNEIDAITSATKTTKAVTEAVNGALEAAGELLEGGVQVD